MVLKNYFSAFSIRKYERIHIIFLLLVFIILMTISSFHQIGGFNVETDFYGSYAPNVQKMLHGGKYYDEDHGPGYIFPLIIFYLILGDIFVAGKILSIISSILFLLFTFLTLKTIFNARNAFFTSILLFVVILRYSVLASTDMFFAFIISFAVFLIFRDGELNFKNLFWGGIVAGYAFMTRLNAIIIPVAVIFSLIFINSPDWTWKQRGRALIIFIGAMILGSMPWYIMNMIYYGKPFISEAHQTLGASLLAKGTSPSGDFAWGAEKEKIAKQYHSLFSLIFHNLPLLIKTIIRNIPAYAQWMLSYLIGFPGYLFVAPGLILLLVRANKIQLTLLTIPLFGFLIYTIVSFITRFYIYIIGYVVFFVIYFLFDSELFSQNKIAQKKFIYLSRFIFILILLFSIQKSKYLVTNDIVHEPRHIKKVAEFFKANSNEKDMLFARKPHLGYFSNRRTKVFPDVKNISDLIQAAHRDTVRFIYYGVVESELRPQLSILKHPEQLSEGLKLIYRGTYPEVFLYEIE